MTPAHYQLFIIAQYVGLSIWHATRASYPQALYWFGAATITCAATWGMAR